MFSLQVLVATMNEKSYIDLYKKMNLKSDAIIINQSDSFSYEENIVGENVCKCYTFNERGLARSRNNALMRATGDILLLADDDMIYSDTYAQDIVDEFRRHPEADAIVFNVDYLNTSNRQSKVINSFKRVGKAESRHYASVRIAFKREKVLLKNIYFNVLFGSGSIYKCGEDTLFLKEFLDSGLKLYKSPIKIGAVDMSDSTWFKGYNEDFFGNKGAVIAAAYPRLCRLIVLIQAFKNSKKRMGSYGKIVELIKWYSQGVDDYHKRLI